MSSALPPSTRSDDEVPKFVSGLASSTRASAWGLKVRVILSAVSFATLVVCEPWLPAASVTQTRIVFAPSLRSPALTVVMCWAGAPV